MTAPDISREAVEAAADDLEASAARRSFRDNDGLAEASAAAAMLRALRDALDAAETRIARTEAALAEHGGRYWEARYRDEAAAAAAAVAAEREACAQALLEQDVSLEDEGPEWLSGFECGVQWGVAAIRARGEAGA